MTNAMEGAHMTGNGIDLRGFIRDIPDWPKEGILFRGITPLLANPEAFAAAVGSTRFVTPAKLQVVPVSVAPSTSVSINSSLPFSDTVHSFAST